MDKEYHNLIDISRSGRVLPWQEKKLKAYFISKSFNRLGYFSKAERISQCGTYLEFKRFTADNSLQLNNANFCKVRLCPLCTWRRSLKIFGQVNKVMNVLTENDDYRFLFLTLTVQNCNGDNLKSVIDNMMQAYNKIFKLAKVKKSILGAFRALEVTHNTNKHSKSFDTYHPHFHCILLVRKSYFNSRSDTYIKQDEWVSMWKNGLNIDYQPIVHIENIQHDKNNIVKAVCETAKYTVKDTDLLNVDESLQDSAIYYLSNSLAHRRLVSFKGEFARIHKRLKLDDAVDGDLVNCDVDDTLRDDLDYVLERYSWHIGYKQYCLIDKDNNFEVVK